MAKSELEHTWRNPCSVISETNQCFKVITDICRLTTRHDFMVECIGMFFCTFLVRVCLCVCPCACMLDGFLSATSSHRLRKKNPADKMIQLHFKTTLWYRFDQLLWSVDHQAKYVKSTNQSPSINTSQDASSQQGNE